MLSCLNPATIRSLPMADFVGVAGQAGFRGVEVRPVGVIDYAKEHGARGLASLFEEASVRPAAVGYPASLMRPADQWASDMASMPELVEIAAGLGIPGGQTVLPWRRTGPTVTGRDEMVDKLGQLADAAARGGLALYLEFIGLYPPPDERGDFVQTIPATLELIREIGRPNVGLLVDAFHWYLRGSVEEIVAIPHGMPIHCHIDDSPPGNRATLTDPMRVLPGEGVIDLPAFLGALRARGWDGYASLELFGEELRAMDPLEAARRARASLDHLGVD